MDPEPPTVSPTTSKATALVSTRASACLQNDLFTGFYRVYFLVALFSKKIMIKYPLFLILKNGPTPTSFLFFSVFSNKHHYNFYSRSM